VHITKTIFPRLLIECSLFLSSAVDPESFPKIGISTSELLHDDYDERVRAQLFMSPEQDIDVFANFGFIDKVHGVAAVRYDKGPLSVETEVNTRDSGGFRLTGIYQYGDYGALFARAERKLGILANDLGNSFETGFRFNSDQTAMSLKARVNLDDLQANDKIEGELALVSKLNKKVTAQVATRGVGYLNTLGVRVSDIACTLAYHSPSSTAGASPAFEAALTVSDMGKRILLSYFQHLVTRRKIYNPTEEANVTQIINYIDLGMEVEMSRTNTGQPQTRLDVGGSWQLNKSLLLKAKAGSSGVHGALKFKTWGLPKLCGSVSSGLDWQGRVRYGISLSVEDLNLVPIYEKPGSELKVTTPYGVITAEQIERLSDKIFIAEQNRQFV
jgi:hypothetical protein